MYQALYTYNRSIALSLIVLVNGAFTMRLYLLRLRKSRNDLMGLSSERVCINLSIAYKVKKSDEINLTMRTETTKYQITLFVCLSHEKGNGQSECSQSTNAAECGIEKGLL